MDEAADDVVFRILDYLSVRDVVRVGSTCRRLRATARAYMALGAGKVSSEPPSVSVDEALKVGWSCPCKLFIRGVLVGQVYQARTSAGFAATSISPEECFARATTAPACVVRALRFTPLETNTRGFVTKMALSFMGIPAPEPECVKYLIAAGPTDLVKLPASSEVRDWMIHVVDSSDCVVCPQLTLSTWWENAPIEEQMKTMERLGLPGVDPDLVYVRRESNHGAKVVLRAIPATRQECDMALDRIIPQYLNKIKPSQVTDKQILRPEALPSKK